MKSTSATVSIVPMRAPAAIIQGRPFISICIIAWHMSAMLLSEDAISPNCFDCSTAGLAASSGVCESSLAGRAANAGLWPSKSKKTVETRSIDLVMGHLDVAEPVNGIAPATCREPCQTAAEAIR